MNSKSKFKRLLSLVLALVMVLGLALPAGAVNEQSDVTVTQVDSDRVSASIDRSEVETQDEAPAYNSAEVVRVSIILEGASTIGAGYSTDGIAGNADAMAYRDALQAQQAKMEQTISTQVLGGKPLKVIWNLTLAANIISAEVAYGKIEAIRALDGVKDVILENRYEPQRGETETLEPNMATSGEMIGSGIAYLDGYTGAGSRIAIIDTGTDTNHQSFSGAAFEYSLKQLAEEAGVSYEEFIADKDLLDVAEITAVLGELNAYEREGSNVAADVFYGDAKRPFNYNYIDRDFDVTHDRDSQGSHGSHVAGIATGNRFIPQGEDFVAAEDSVLFQGVAPDAQLITMKVFGKAGGAYDSDYMAAIEDAVTLGCDAVNLSLGSGNPGFTTSSYQEIMDMLTKTDTVVAMSAGNSGYWVENAVSGIPYLYSDDVSFATGGSPGSFTNSFGVASVDNVGSTGNFLQVGENRYSFSQTEYRNRPIATLDTSADGNGTELDYVFFANVGVDASGANLLADYADVTAGKLVFVSRGDSSFYQKHMAVDEVGGVACVVCDNQPGLINMDLTDSRSTIPCVAITLSDANEIKAQSTPVYAEDGTTVLYYTGKVTISKKIAALINDVDYYTMSSFSSWGSPSNLSMKPEITAPGGSIYSVNGMIASGDAYEVMSGTSMASPQIAGMSALVAQYIKDNQLDKATGLSVRQLTQSLLMSTAEPVLEADTGYYYSILKQGAGLANVGAAVRAESYILVDGQPDGKVKVELGDDPARTGSYNASFTIYNLGGSALEYTLAADVFTQDIFSYGDDVLLDTWTVPMGFTAQWTADGATVTDGALLGSFDVNGDGLTDVADAQLLLDLAVGNALKDTEGVDVDGDGDVDAADAAALLKLLSTAVVEVPANGSVEISVTLNLTEEEKTWLDAYYGNGAYVQAFLYAEPAASAEGELGVSHSIPVLGYYGNWSDPSMFDVGTALEFNYGLEDRIPYTPSSNGQPNYMGNFMAVKYSGETGEYLFGGNPLLEEAEYLPQRASLNNLNGDMLSKQYFIAIRNAGNAKFLVTNAETGEVYMDNPLGPVSAAYYYVNGGYWTGVQKSLNLGWSGVDAQGNKLPEGTVVELSLILAPELYADAEGLYSFEGLGHGAYLTTTVTIDNTAPVLDDVRLSLTGKGMTVAATDNQYIAAIAVFDSKGEELLDAYCPNQTVAGQMQTVDLDLGAEGGDSFLVQIYDYAMNTTTYEVELNLGGEEEALPQFIALNCLTSEWHGLFEGVTPGTTELLGYGDPSTFAATMVDGFAFMMNQAGELCVAPQDDLEDTIFIDNVAGPIITDLAYNPVDGYLYGVSPEAKTGFIIKKIDKLTGELMETFTVLGCSANTLAIDDEGLFYVIDIDSGDLYSFNPGEGAELVGATGHSMAYIQAIEYNPYDGYIYWANYSTDANPALLKVDPATGETTQVGTLQTEYVGLMVTQQPGGNWYDPTDEILSLSIPGELNLLKGERVQLQAVILPWTVSNRDIIWTSSDSTVAQVSAEGVVTAMNKGEATITATSALDPSFSAQCVVTVETVDITLKGALQDANGNPMLFTWDMGNDKTWTAGIGITPSINSITYDPVAQQLLVCDAVDNSWNMHYVDMTTGETVETATNGVGVPLWDMEACKFLTGEDKTNVVGVYNFYYIAPQDPMALTGSAFTLQANMAGISGGSYLVAVTSLGHETISYQGVQYEAEHVILLDNAGYLWHYWTYSLGAGQYSAILSYSPTNLALEFPGNGNDMYCSLVSGEDGNLYLSAFNGSTNELYQLSETATGYKALYLGDVGADVWPAALYEVTGSGETSNGGVRVLDPATTLTQEAETFTAEELMASLNNKARTAVGSLNAFTGSDEETVVVKGGVLDGDASKLTVTADEATDSGLIRVEYDPSVVTVERVWANAQLSSFRQEEGAVIFAYASEELIPAGETLLELTVNPVKDTTCDVKFTLITLERNNQSINSKKTVNVPAADRTHEWGEWEIITPATCTEEGQMKRYCQHCTFFQSETIEATGHDMQDWYTVYEGTCTEDGLERCDCANCDHYETRAIEAEGHEMGQWYTVYEPTCTEEGLERRDCANCDHCETQAIEATGHDYDYVVTDPTCTEEGYTTFTCSVCGESYVDDYVDALGHDYEAVVTAPTCTEEGYTTYTCSVCGDSYVDDYVDATGHQWGEWITLVEGTCEDGCFEYRECQVCHETEYRTGDPAAECPSAKFVDLEKDAWYHNGVDFVLGNGIMTGVADDRFDPYGAVTRAQLATILYRVAGAPAVEGLENPFSDVPADTWYTDAVIWAADAQIVNGVGEGKFDPNAPVSREQIAAMLWRFCGKPYCDEYVLGQFKDAHLVSSYAYYPMNWCVNMGLINGVTADELQPQATATRVQMAVILHRLLRVE